MVQKKEFQLKKNTFAEVVIVQLSIVNCQLPY